MSGRQILAFAVLWTAASRLLDAQPRPGLLPPVASRTFFDPATYAPPITAPFVTANSELRDLVERYFLDRGVVQRRYGAGAPERSERLRTFYQSWLQALPRIDFDKLSHPGKVDYVLLRNRIEYDALVLRREERAAAAPAPPPVPLTGPVTGTPVGREMLIEELKNEMVAYTPEQFLEIGKREYEWTENEMKKVARTMGFGDDWHAALEKAKNDYVPRGAQPGMVRDLEIQGEAFVRAHDLVTIPNQSHDAWRMTMMSPDQMRTAPFFLGGEGIQVSYPVEGMPDSLSLMIMKGNGPHLSHATVFHEMIPGHQMQGFMSGRFNSHRAPFGSPFYVEGWALYWEMQLWDLGFNATPEDRMGALFWRMHRAARILFTLNFHLGNWTAQQCVDFLIANGHEPWTAESEVRGHMRLAGRTPLYQAGYLMGALQLRSIYREVVVEKKLMTTKQFNDAVLREGQMPMEMLRVAIEKLPLTRDYSAQWKYYGDVPGSSTLPARPAPATPATSVDAAFAPDVNDLAASTSELRDIVDRYVSDRGLLMRFYTVQDGPERAAKLRAFYTGWQRRLAALDQPGAPRLSREGHADAQMLAARVHHELALLARDDAARAATRTLVPFADTIAALQEQRQRLVFVTPDQAVAALTRINRQIAAARTATEARVRGRTAPTPWVADRAARQLDRVRGALGTWFTFFNSYDPAFTAKVPARYAEVTQALTDYASYLRTAIAGYTADAAVAAGNAGGAGARGAGGGGRRGGGGGGGRGGTGTPTPQANAAPLLARPIGRAAVIEELQSELLSETPEQLIALARRELTAADDGSPANPVRDVTVPPLATATGTAGDVIGFIAARYNTHRALFDAPVYRAGLEAYWIDDHAVRRRNAALLLAGLQFHLGQSTVAQAVDTLVTRGAFDRPAAEAQVRQIAESESVLAAGGGAVGRAHLAALYAEVVSSRRLLTSTVFHDRLLRAGAMPASLSRSLFVP